MNFLTPEQVNRRTFLTRSAYGAGIQRALPSAGMRGYTPAGTPG